MLTYFYDTINRNAIVVTPKQPLFDWINGIYPESPVSASDDDEGTVYLVKERDSNEAIEKWLNRNFDDIFQNELNNCNKTKTIGLKKEPSKCLKNGSHLTSIL